MVFCYTDLQYAEFTNELLFSASKPTVLSCMKHLWAGNTFSCPDRFQNVFVQNIKKDILFMQSEQNVWCFERASVGPEIVEDRLGRMGWEFAILNSL